MITPVQFWRNRRIAAKINLSFCGFFVLVFMVLATWLVSVERENRIEKEIELCRDIEKSVLDIDRKIEKAKHLHRDFFLYQGKSEFNTAHVQYAQPSVRLISQAVALSGDLQKKISHTGIDYSLRHRNVDLNLYLASAKRFADTSIQSIELITRLVAPQDGLEPRFENLVAGLAKEAINSSEMHSKVHDVVVLFPQYKVSRERHVMQSILNAIYDFRQEINEPGFISLVETKIMMTMLDSLTQLGQEILDVDKELKQIFNDFSLQEANTLPIAQALVELAHEEVGRAKEKLRISHQKTFFLIAALSGIALIWGFFISRAINRSVTLRIAGLTEVAKDLRQGHFEGVFADNSADELGQFARTFNAMAGRIKGLVEDLEAKIAERTRQLVESEQWLRHLFENSPLGISRSRLNGKVLFINKAGAEMLGYDSTEEVLSITSFTETVYVDPGKRYEVVQLLLAQGEMSNFECQWKKKNGEIIWVSLNVRLEASGAVEENDKEPILNGFVLDITKRKKAEEESARLEILNRQLHKNQSLARMAGSIAHHFNNQLGVVIGNLDLAMDDGASDADVADYLAEAMHGANKAAEVSAQMLTYLGKTSCKYTQLNISETCRQILSLLQISAPRNVQLIEHLPASGPHIHANANQIQQLVTNLLTNAYEAIGEKQGIVRLSVKTVRAEDIPAAHRYPADWQPKGSDFACIEVVDDGCGIVAEVMDNIFDPFYSSKFTGRGLGLAVAWGIVSAQEGVITVASEVSQGSTFRVFFPLSVAEASSVDGKHTQGIGNGV